MDNVGGLESPKDGSKKGSVGDGADERGGRARFDVDADGVVAEVGQGEHQGFAQVAG